MPAQVSQNGFQNILLFGAGSSFLPFPADLLVHFLPLTIGRERQQDVDSRLRRKRKEEFYNVIQDILFHFALTLPAVGPANPSVEQPEIVVDFSNGSDR